MGGNLWSFKGSCWGCFREWERERALSFWHLRIASLENRNRVVGQTSRTHRGWDPDWHRFQSPALAVQSSISAANWDFAMCVSNPILFPNAGMSSPRLRTYASLHRCKVVSLRCTDSSLQVATEQKQSEGQECGYFHTPQSSPVKEDGPWSCPPVMLACHRAVHWPWRFRLSAVSCAEKGPRKCHRRPTQNDATLNPIPDAPNLRSLCGHRESNTIRFAMGHRSRLPNWKLTKP